MKKDKTTQQKASLIDFGINEGQSTAPERDIWDEIEEDLKTMTPNTAAPDFLSIIKKPLEEQRKEFRALLDSNGITFDPSQYEDYYNADEGGTITAEEQQYRAYQKQQERTPEAIKRLNDLRIDAKDEIQAPPIAIKLLNSDSSWSSFGTLGNFSTIIGKAKSRKSSAVSMIAASGLIKAPISSKFLSSLPEDKSKVLYFDTEQSKYDVQKVVKRIEGLVKGQNMENFHAFALRSLKPKERLELIEAAVYHFENVGLVIIDGIRDLVTSINDEAEATAITSCLLRWTEQKEIHIVNVLHQNKGNEHARGHIGTEMINKSESVFSIAKDPQEDNISIVTPEFTRGKEPETFAFSIDESELPFVCGLPENPTKKVESHLLLSNEQITQLLTDVIKPEMKATEFKQVLKIKLKEEYPRAKTGATSINDFYSWLQLKGFIQLKGTAAAKVVIQTDPHEGEREPEPIAKKQPNNRRKTKKKQ